MSFRFAARTILELGKELISSDEVALYELIKNAIDAGSHASRSPSDWCCLIGHTLQRWKIWTTEFPRAEFWPTSARGCCTGHLLIAFQPLWQLSTPPRDGLSRFRAALKAAYRRHNWIEIRDKGEGMSLDTLYDVYLTVGTRSRRRMNVAGATFLGDKGVGRLSAMRLGNFLQVTTATADEFRWNILKIDWCLFSR